MKLILCKKCNDVFKLDYLIRTCKCGETGGKYVDNLIAKYYGEEALPLGIDNFSLSSAIKKTNMEEIRGERIESFIITNKCDTLIKVHRHTLG